MGRERKGRATAIGLVLAATLAAPAQARAAWQSSPVARLTFEGRYDQDLLGDGGGPAGIFAPSLGWRLRKPTVDLEASYALDVYTYAHFDRGSTSGGENHRLRASQTIDLDPRTRLSFRQAGEQVYDPTALARPGVLRTVGEVLFLEADAELTHAFGRRLRGGIAVRAERAWYDDPAAFDGTTVAPGVFGSHSVSPRDELVGRYRVQLFAVDGGEGSLSHEPALGWVRLLGPHLRLGAEAGPAVLVRPGGDVEVGPRGRAELSWRWPRTTFTFSAERTLVGAAGLDEPLWADVALGSVSYRATAALTLSAGVAAFRNGEPAGALVASGFAGEGTAEYRLAEGLYARVAVRRVAQRDETGVGVDLDRNIYAAGLAWRFDGPPPR